MNYTYFSLPHIRACSKSLFRCERLKYRAKKTKIEEGYLKKGTLTSSKSFAADISALQPNTDFFNGLPERKAHKRCKRRSGRVFREKVCLIFRLFSRKIERKGRSNTVASVAEENPLGKPQNCFFFLRLRDLSISGIRARLVLLQAIFLLFSL